MGQLNLGNGANFIGGSGGELADAPKGMVVQLLRHHRGSGQWASTSSSFQVISNMNKSITPKKAGNLIYVEYHMYVRVYENNSHRSRCHFEIRDNMSGDNYNTTRSKYIYHYYDYGGSGILGDVMATITYSVTAPSTTAIDFAVYGRLESGDAMEVNPSNEVQSDNSVTIYEIAQ